MSEPSAERLAELVGTLMRREHHTPICIERDGRLARNTVNGVIRGYTKQVTRPTLEGFARAIATDHYTGVLDTEMQEDVHGQLNAAAGFIAPEPDRAQHLFELGLYYWLADRPRMRRWLRAIARDAQISDAELDALGQSP